jgi:hyperosmotically inducible protein
MNLKIKSIKIASCLGLPLFLFVVGCNDKSNSNDTTVAPSPGTNAMGTNVDNSKINVRDRNDASLTPGDQGNSDADRAITQKIRQMVVSSTNDYSMTAKNIKIITADGKVTLRGPVKADAEKTGIGDIATGVAGAGNVDNQLEVKANP